MQSRRDHVHAYQFITSRLGSALVIGEPGLGEQPLRRSGLGLAFGVVIAMLLCAGFAVFGLISPGGATAWTQPGSIIVEKETGNRYIYLNGTLYPTLNSASAMLFFGGGSAQGVFRSVSRNSLAGVPHGPAVGIPGAPDAVPSTANLLPASWALCAKPADPTPTMLVDLDPDTPRGAMPANQRFLLVGDDGKDYVVWHDTVYQIGSHTELVALGLGDVQPTAVPIIWIHALRSGPTLSSPDVPDAGRPGPTVDGMSTQVGQVFTTSIGGQTQNYVLRNDGVAPVNATALAMLSAMPDADPPRAISPATLAQFPVSADTSTLRGVPDLVNAPTYQSYQSYQSAVCVRQSSSGDTVNPGTLVTEQLSVPPGATTLHVPPGEGMLAQATPPASPTSSRDYFLITDVGRKFAMSQQAISALGLSGNPVSVPTQLLAAMPAGPALVTGPSVLTANLVGGQ